MKKIFISIICILILVVGSTGCGKGEKNEAKESNSTGQVTTSAKETSSEEKEPEWLYPAYNREKGGVKWGYINEKGEFIIKPEYETAEDFQKCGLAVVQKNGRYGLIDMKGNLVEEPAHNYITFVDKSLYVLSDEEGSKLINKEGKTLFETKGFIREFSNGLAVYSNGNYNSNSNILYGYINTSGKVVIDAKYSNAEPFSANKALVEVEQGKYSIIDKNDKVITTLSYGNVNGLADKMMVFYDQNNKYGYLSDDGNVLIDAKFAYASPFSDGYAVISGTGDSDQSLNGVINKKGEIIIDTKYQSITDLGDGLFAVIDKSDFPIEMHAQKAIFNKKGEQLSDFIYYDVQNYESGVASATDEKSTFFLNRKGEINEELPKLPGIGHMSIQKNIVKAEIDNELEYLTKDGKVIWKSADTYPLDSSISVKDIKFRPDRATIIDYPELSGLSDTTVQNKINSSLKENFIGGITESEKEDGHYMSDLNEGFAADINKDVIIIKHDGYLYPIGAAHGQPSQTYYHINKNTGKFYTLTDLFKKGSDYVTPINNIIKTQIEQKASEDASGVFPDGFTSIKADQYFIITKDALKVYFYPYEIGPYAAGFITFDIPYNQILDVIDTQGDFWKSFDKNVGSVPEKVSSNPPQNPDQTPGSTDEAVQTAMNNYETTIIDAVNNNDFALVEPYLVPGSNLYNSQKQLVSRLYGKNIKEKLVGFKIENIKYSADKTDCKAYVTDQVAIQYPGEDFKTKSYSYIYSLSFDAATNEYKLYDIAAWSK